MFDKSMKYKCSCGRKIILSIKGKYTCPKCKESLDYNGRLTLDLMSQSLSELGRRAEEVMMVPNDILGKLGLLDKGIKQ